MCVCLAPTEEGGGGGGGGGAGLGSAHHQQSGYMLPQNKQTKK